MATITIVQKISLYDDATTGRSISYSTQRVGTGDDAGLASALNTAAITPGSLVESTDDDAIDGTIYTRTDISETSTVPTEVKTIAGVCWTEEVQTAHEAKLRNG